MELLTIPQTSQPLSPMSQESQCPSPMSQCLIADNPLNSFDAPPSTPNPQRQNVGPTLAVGLVRVGLLSQMSHVPNVTCPKCPKGSQSQMSLVPNVSCPKCLLSQMSHVPNITNHNRSLPKSRLLLFSLPFQKTHLLYFLVGSFSFSFSNSFPLWSVFAFVKQYSGMVAYA